LILFYSSITYYALFFYFELFDDKGGTPVKKSKTVLAS